MRARLAKGRVFHKRFAPVTHALATSYPSLLVDLDELSQTNDALRYFSSSRFNLTSLRLADYGDGGDLRAWVLRQLTQVGAAVPTRIMLLTAPRILGYAFNPISCFFCFDDSERLCGVVFEVNSTFGERIAYAFPVGDAKAGVHRFECAKAMRVSPFNRTEGYYRFQLRFDNEGVSLGIQYLAGGELILTASHNARFVPLTDASLLSAFGAVPFSMVKTMAGIHWNALVLWLKGLPFVPARAAHVTNGASTRKQIAAISRN